MSRGSGPQILVTSASEERLDTSCKQRLIKSFDWVFVLMTITLIWLSALTRTCLDQAIFIGVVSTIVVLLLFLVIYKVGNWRFHTNKSLEQSQVIFDFDKLLPKKRNSVMSDSSITSA